MKKLTRTEIAIRVVLVGGFIACILDAVFVK
jgi:hypothetical protein